MNRIRALHPENEKECAKQSVTKFFPAGRATIKSATNIYGRLDWVFSK